MTKSELIVDIVRQTNVGKDVAGTVVNSIFSDIIPDKLAELEEVSIAGFGKFTSALREARTGRNPQSGESIQIAAKVAVKFKPAAELKNKVN